MAQLGKLSIAITATTKGLDKAAAKAKKALKSIGSAANSLGGVLGIAGTGAAALGLVRVADAYSVMGSQLEYVTGSAEKAEHVQSQLYEISKQTGTNMKENADSFTKLTQAQEQTGLTTEQNLKVIGTLNALMIKTGTSGSQASAAMLQLSQALTSGKLAGDEFRSMSENAPGLLNALGEAMQIPRDQLKQMASDGELTSERLAQAFLDIAESGAVAFEDLPETASKGWNAVVLAFEQAWDKINDKTGIMKSLHDMLLEVGNWLEENTERFVEWAEQIKTISGFEVSMTGSLNSMADSFGTLLGAVTPVVNILQKLYNIWMKVSTLPRLALDKVYSTAGKVISKIGNSIGGGGDEGSGTTVNNFNTSISKSDAQELGNMNQTAGARL